MTRAQIAPPAALTLLALLLAASPATRSESGAPIIAFTGARILPVDGPPIEDGVLVVEGTTIRAVGPRGAVSIPGGAEVRDVTGRVIIPGLVDTHSHIGGIGGADGSGPIQPEIRIYDSLNAADSGFRRAVAGGLTTLNVMPGSGHLNSGQTVYLKLRGGRTIESLFIRDREGRITGGMKFANGTNSIRSAPFPGTRGKSAALLREQLIKAREYADKVKRAGGDPEKLPSRDLGLEALGEVLAGTRVVHFHTHRADDLMTVLRLRDEFGFKVVLHHASEAFKIPGELARAGVPVSLILVDSPGGKLEAREIQFETGAVLEKAGVKIAYHSDDWITDCRLFLRMAALAVRAGLSRETALRALTLSGAEMLELQDRVGSLTPGKDADLAILSGDPFSVYTKVLETWVEGKKVFDRSDPDDRLHAVGGFGAGRDQSPYLCCTGQEAGQ